MHSEFRIGIIGGTGLGEALVRGMRPRDVREQSIDTPFGRPNVPIVTGMLGDTPVAMLRRHGEGHVLNPAAVPHRANIYALKALGCTYIVASGAVGSLREEIRPGDLVICDQLIDRTDGRERTFYERAAVHVEFAEPFCPVMRQWLLAAARNVQRLRTHDGGCYVCIEGPSFSTRAESLMHRQWGADVVGMTALPEARLAREAEIAYALVALPTDYDCWRPRKVESRRFEARQSEQRTASNAHDSLLQEILANLERATQACIELLQAALQDVTLLRLKPSPAHDALRLAIWSDKAKLDPAEIQRLSVLWGRHFTHQAEGKSDR